MRDPGDIEMLPGTEADFRPTRSEFDAARAISSARLRQDARDLVDLLLLIGVNLMFLVWESAQIPLLGRDATMALLLLTNAFFVGSWFVSRVVPLVRARRISSSWSSEERARVRL